MNDRIRNIGARLRVHFRETLHRVVYPTLDTKVSEAEFMAVVQSSEERLMASLATDPSFCNLITSGDTTDASGQFNARAIHDALVKLAERTNNQALRARISHLASSAEMTFQAAKLM